MRCPDVGPIRTYPWPLFLGTLAGMTTSRPDATAGLPAAPPAAAAGLPAAPLAAAGDGRHDFDFLFGGRWKIHNRRLKKRLQGCTDWESFEAWQEVRPVLGGLGNTDSFSCVFPDGKPLEGMTLRLFNPATRLWSLYWADDRGGELQPPVVGRFVDGRGEFDGDDTLAGQPIRVRFVWSGTSATRAHWEQAFSADGGKTWETNWFMEMERAT